MKTHIEYPRTMNSGLAQQVAMIYSRTGNQTVELKCLSQIGRRRSTAEVVTETFTVVERINSARNTKTLVIRQA